jgi:hypothetical protein
MVTYVKQVRHNRRRYVDSRLPDDRQRVTFSGMIFGEDGLPSPDSVLCGSILPFSSLGRSWTRSCLVVPPLERDAVCVFLSCFAGLVCVDWALS